jgi:hypothetical protein
MSKAEDLAEIISRIIEGLRRDVDYYQGIAVEAAKIGDTVNCKVSLERQKIAIDSLIKLAETASSMGK